MRNWRLRTKLVAVLLVPVLIALALAGLRAKSELDSAAVYEQTATDMQTVQDVVALVNELQKERALVVSFVAANRSGDTARMQEQILRSNAGLAKLKEFARTRPERNVITNRLSQRLTAVEAIRGAATGSQYPDVAVQSSYTALLDTVLLAGSEFTSAIVDPELSRLANAALAVVAAKEFLARQNAILLIAGARKGFPAGTLDQARAADASLNAAVANFRANASPEDAQFFADTFSGPQIDDREGTKLASFNRADQQVADPQVALDIDLADLAADGAVAADALGIVQIRLLDRLRGLATDAANDARARALRDAAVVLAALIIALLVMLIVARSLLKPLRVLRRDALDVANRRLPATVQRILADPDPVAASKTAVDPVPVFTREETGQLARSFDAVHDQAVKMATEQALLRDNINSIFVNLSRRSQALVERQLSLIDRLEQDEQDPDQLASLFELDHLATRMRRNSESLLVLSGSGLSRQLNRPVPASEVVGAAVSEVEHYARIEVVSAPDVTVQGRAVSDLVHVIAELLDNATFFSEPEKKVIVRMAVTRKKELAIQITDSGVGMSDDEIEAANDRLANPPDLDVAVTRRMGLYVVARLAKRHSIMVRLRDNEDIEGGLIARIHVPADLVAPAGGPTSTMPSMPSMPSMDFDRPATRASGIAGAFTGNTPRLRRDGSVDSGPERSGPTPTRAVSESQVDRPVQEVAGYPPFAPNYEQGTVGTGAPVGPGHNANAANGVADTQGGWGAEPAEAGTGGGEGPRNGQADEPTTMLFGHPLPEPLPGSAEPPGSTPEAAPHVPTARVPATHRAPSGGRTGELSQEEVALNVDAPTERLPIYEAVLSQWFEAADTGAHRRPAQPDAANGAETDEAPAGAAAYVAAPSGNGEPTADPAPAEYAEPEAWVSPGDEGWEAARALLDSTVEDPLTSAGLPKRVPKAHLVPGSAAPREESAEQPAGPPLPPRSADAVRGRMSSFQQGVRRGRHALIEAYAGDQSGSDQSRQDEEQE